MDIELSTFQSLIEGTRSARARLEAQLAQLRGQVHELEREKENLTMEIVGYQLALRRLFPDETPVELEVESGMFELQSDGQSEPYSSMTRTKAVEQAVRALTSAGNPASPAEIEEFLARNGRTDTRDQIGAALSYLNKKKILERASRANWRVWTGKGIDDPDS